MLLLSIISRSVTSRHTNPVAGSRPASMLDLLHAVNPLPEADVYALVARMLVSVCGCVRAGVYALVAQMLVSMCGLGLGELTNQTQFIEEER